MVVTSPPPQMRVIEPPPVGTMTAPPPTVTRFETNQACGTRGTCRTSQGETPPVGGLKGEGKQPFSEVPYRRKPQCESVCKEASGQCEIRDCQLCKNSLLQQAVCSCFLPGILDCALLTLGGHYQEPTILLSINPLKGVNTQVTFVFSTQRAPVTLGPSIPPYTSRLPGMAVEFAMISLSSLY